MTAQTVARGAAAVLMLLGTAAICVLLQVVSGQTNAGTTALASLASLAGLLCAQSVARSRDDGARILLAFAAILATFLLLDARFVRIDLIRSQLNLGVRRL
jgi:hypothetical protein